jgi:hypothetical protein
MKKWLAVWMVVTSEPDTGDRSATSRLSPAKCLTVKGVPRVLPLCAMEVPRQRERPTLPSGNAESLTPLRSRFLRMAMLV